MKYKYVPGGIELVGYTRKVFEQAIVAISPTERYFDYFSKILTFDNGCLPALEKITGIRGDSSKTKNPVSGLMLLRLIYVGQVKALNGHASSGMLEVSGENQGYKVRLPEQVMRDWFEKSLWERKQEESSKDFFATLGVSENATKHEIRKGFNAVALKHHPDVSPDADSIRIFQLAMNAYKVLKNKESRIKYKAGLEFQRSLSQKEWDGDSFQKSYKPPLRCGLVLADVRTIIGRLYVEKIYAWNSIKNDAGETLSVKWDKQTQRVVKTWI